jgi:hypothetical protein
MKLNFWQWLGVLLLVVGGCLYIYRETTKKTSDTVPSNVPSPTSQAVPG